MELRCLVRLVPALGLAGALLLGCRPGPASGGAKPPATEPAAEQGVIAGRPAPPANERQAFPPPERRPEPPHPKPKAEPKAEWETYRGAWFTIEYPTGFEVVPRERSRTGDGYDGVSFLSPDGRVEFYVNSPQWQGEPGWIDMIPGEDIVASESSEEGSQQTQRVTLAGPERAYFRLYEDTTDTALNTRLVFGYKYRDDGARREYHERYAHFKGSLVQFAD